MEYDYKNLPPFKWFVLENFPFIEADFDALTNWQLFCKLGKEMNKIIETVNASGEQVENLTNAFISLETYVQNYFDNLDIQEEINNKLDDMAESGELTDIIAQYLQLAGLLVYNTKADLKSAENLANGSIAFTIGENAYNDGMSNYYKIRTITSGDTVDDNNILALQESETLIAERLDMGTKLNIVDELPETKENNAEYKVKLYEETIDEIPESQHEYVVNDYEELAEMGTDYLKVGTWNIYVGNSPYNKNFSVMDNFTKIRKICDKIGANILGMNECTAGKLFKPENLYLTQFYKYFEMTPTWYNMVPCVDFGNGIISHEEATSSTGARFTNYEGSQHQGYTKNVYTVKENKTLSFYSIHLSLDQATRIAQIGELYTIVSADTNDYIVIAGDVNFNTEQNATYLSSFINAGFHCANNGDFKTYDDSRNIGIDEIMVSSNIDIIETHTIENIDGASDHFPIYSKIKLN